MICSNVMSENLNLKKYLNTYIETLSHDLQIPVIAQVRALELLLSGQLGEFNEEQKEILNLTLNSCKYLHNMVNTLLSTYKFESGEAVLHYDMFDINMLTTETIKEISYMTKDNSTTIHFSPSNQECFISADRNLIKRVITNFLSNAINFAFPSSKIYINIDIIDDNIDFRITNSSPYIDPELIQNLFKKYVTYSDKYNKVGIGLGLYLAKKIIEAHNGTIIAQSSPEKTNTFGFTMPLFGKIPKNILFD